MKIRLATKNDASGILEIYKPFITDTVVSFEETVPSISEFEKRITGITAYLPWLVCEVNNEIAGYAYASEHRERASYRWTKEVSVYLAQAHRDKGVAAALYGPLIELLKLQGVHNLLAGTTLPNEASVRFHKKMGFKEVGTFRNIGHKFGQWCHTYWLEMVIGDENNPPKELVNINEVLKTEAGKAALRG